MPMIDDSLLRRVRLLGLLLWALLVHSALCIDEAKSQSGNEARYDFSYGSGRKIGELSKKDIRESSGMAASLKNEQLFWTHNDSGDKPRLFAFDHDGKHRGTCRIRGADSVDWEDMDIVKLDGVDYFVIGDIGDNRGKRDHCVIYFAPEPDNPREDTKVELTIKFNYEDGPRDCEALALDVTRREIILVEKTRVALYSSVYAIRIPDEASAQPIIAQQIGRVPCPLVTAMDMSHDGLHAILATYGHGYEYQRQPDESWQKVFANPGRLVELPIRKQGEAICYGHDGVSLYVTSEKRPCPLFMIPGKQLSPGDKRRIKVDPK